MITTKEAAARVGVSQRRIQKLCQTEPGLARMMGRDWFVDEVKLDALFKGERRPGRRWPDSKKEPQD